jgi:hypothetical protein
MVDCVGGASDYGTLLGAQFIAPYGFFVMSSAGGRGEAAMVLADKLGVSPDGEGGAANDTVPES